MVWPVLWEVVVAVAMKWFLFWSVGEGAEVAEDRL
jgi:hypothetical protein